MSWVIVVFVRYACCVFCEGNLLCLYKQFAVIRFGAFCEDNLLCLLNVIYWVLLGFFH